MNKPLKLACIGCGARAQTYATLAMRRPDRFEIVAGADPVPARVEKLRQISGRADFRGFGSAEALLAAGKLADVMIIATQDSDHIGFAAEEVRVTGRVIDIGEFRRQRAAARRRDEEQAGACAPAAEAGVRVGAF
jgi:ornithine cyclodeaminase/alanine dehydrogenase-like protein (mu-crystallin family)